VTKVEPQYQIPSAHRPDPDHWWPYDDDLDAEDDETVRRIERERLEEMGNPHGGAGSHPSANRSAAMTKRSTTMITPGTGSACNKGCRCDMCREATRLARARQRENAPAHLKPPQAPTQASHPRGYSWRAWPAVGCSVCGTGVASSLKTREHGQAEGAGCLLGLSRGDSRRHRGGHGSPECRGAVAPRGGTSRPGADLPRLLPPADRLRQIPDGLGHNGPGDRLPPYQPIE